MRKVLVGQTLMLNVLEVCIMETAGGGGGGYWGEGLTTWVAPSLEV